MKFNAPLTEGLLLRRYKRFLADIRLASGETVTAHCANPGAMLGVAVEGARVWCSKSASKTRKLPWSWELAEVGGALIAVNTSNPNRIVAEAIEAGAVPELQGYERFRREVRYGEKSRVDLLLEGEGRRPCYVEIKNVHLSRAPGLAEFPDCVTARGARHLGELARVAADGARAVMVYVVQRNHCNRFRLAADLDPAYAVASDRAAAAGVETLCYNCDIDLDGVALSGPVAFSR